jgi:dynein heavy chain 1
MFDGEDSFMEKAIKLAHEDKNLKHVMEFTKIRVLEAMFALIRKGISNVIEYNDTHSELGMDFTIL